MSEKKYFSYVRVSTQRQGQVGTSLTEQQAAIENFARNWNLQIIKRFEERETAAKQGRPVFLEMLKQLKQRKADGVIIHKIDRSARNLKDWADLGSLIDNGVEVHFASESLDLNSRGGRLSADIQAVVASDYIRNLREETKKGMYGRLKQGLFPFRAPIGYLDCGKGKPKRIDPISGPIIRKGFELYATGNWSLKSLCDELFELGLRNKSGSKITINGLSTILNSQFYIGVIKIAKTGDVYSGIHQPLISRALFTQVQNVLKGRNVTRKIIHDFTYRRMIRCGRCKNRLIGELQKGHVYYRCQTSQCTSGCLKEETVNSSIFTELKKLELNPDEFQLYRTLSTEMFADWKEESEKLRNELIERQQALKDRSARLMDSYLDGMLDKRDYLERKSQLQVDEKRMAAQIQGLGKNWEDAPSKFEEFLELANAAYLSFKSAPIETKREMVEIMTSNLTANGKSVVITLEDAFDLLAKRPTIPVGSPYHDTARTFSSYISQLLKILNRIPFPSGKNVPFTRWLRLVRQVALGSILSPRIPLKNAHVGSLARAPNPSTQVCLEGFCYPFFSIHSMRSATGWVIVVSDCFNSIGSSVSSILTV